MSVPEPFTTSRTNGPSKSNPRAVRGRESRISTGVSLDESLLSLDETPSEPDVSPSYEPVTVAE